MIYPSNPTRLSLLLLLLFAATKPTLAVSGLGDTLIIIVSGGFRGRATGCHCAAGPQGGLERRESLLISEFGDFRPPGLDCGAILDLDPGGGMARSRCSLKGLARQGLKIVGVAGRDLYYGRSFLDEAASSASVQLTSANIIGTNGKAVYPLWLSIEVKGVEVAVASLAETLPRQAAPGSLTTSPPDSVIATLEQTIPPNAKLRVLLTDLAEAPLRTLLNQTSLFDVALTSSRQIYTATPFMVGSCVVIHPEPDGRSLEAFIIPPDLRVAAGWMLRRPIERTTPEDPQFTNWLNDCLGSESGR